LSEGSLGAVFPEFLLLHPKIQLQILATDQRVDIINDRLDLAIRAQLTEETDAELTMRVLSKVDLILVANKEISGRCRRRRDRIACRRADRVVHRRAWPSGRSWMSGSSPGPMARP
jgi:DNA-binding transcriptional LysR family regulator